jgi:hypothetical protein
MFDILKRLSVSIFFAALFAFAAAAEPPAADPARVAAAKDMMEATGVMKQMDSMVAAMGEGFRNGAADASGAAKAEEAGQEFDRHMKRLMSYREQMVDDFAVLYAKRFTVDELKSIADFYRSPTGAKFIAAMPELIQDGAEIGIKYSRLAVDDEAAHKPLPQ